MFRPHMWQCNTMSMNRILSEKIYKTISLHVIDVIDVLYRNTFKSRLQVTIILKELFFDI